MRTRSETLVDGVLAGVIGYAVTVVTVGAVCLIRGQSPFFVAALLGTDMFFGGVAPTTAGTAGAVLAYNGVHLLVFLVLGAALAWLARLAGSTPQGWYIALIGVLFIAGHVTALPIWFSEPVQAALPLWLVASATALAVTAMSIFLVGAGSGVGQAMHEPDEVGAR